MVALKNCSRNSPPDSWAVQTALKTAELVFPPEVGGRELYTLPACNERMSDGDERGSDQRWKATKGN